MKIWILVSCEERSGHSIFKWTNETTHFTWGFWLVALPRLAHKRLFYKVVPLSIHLFAVKKAMGVFCSTAPSSKDSICSRFCQKCVLDASKFELQWYMVSAQDTSTVSEKIQSIVAFPTPPPPPSSLNQLRCYLMMLYFYRRFLPVILGNTSWRTNASPQRHLKHF